MIRETHAYYCTGAEKIAHGQKLENIVEHVGWEGAWYSLETGDGEFAAEILTPLLGR